jgi:hypothetical protein
MNFSVSLCRKGARERERGGGGGVISTHSLHSDFKVEGETFNDLE